MWFFLRQRQTGAYRWRCQLHPSTPKIGVRCGFFFSFCLLFPLEKQREPRLLGVLGAGSFPRMMVDGKQRQRQRQAAQAIRQFKEGWRRLDCSPIAGIRWGPRGRERRDEKQAGGRIKGWLTDATQTETERANSDARHRENTASASGLCQRKRRLAMERGRSKRGRTHTHSGRSIGLAQERAMGGDDLG